MYILGISCYYHDAASVIIKDGEIVAAAEEERFSRIKHDFSFPKKAIEFCLKKAGIKAQDLDYVVFYEKPLLKFERIFLTSFIYAPNSISLFKEGMKEWFFNKLWIKSHIISQLKISANKLLFCEHHLSHAASSFFVSPFKKAAIISIDGVGEWTTVSWGVGNDKKISLKEEIRYPHSLGLLYSAFTAFVGFEVNEGEYKLMGLAPYGQPRYVDKIRKLIEYRPEGSFRLNLNYFSYQRSVKGIYTRKFEELFGKANRSPGKVIPYYADIAASIQSLLEQILIDIASYVQKKTGEEYLCYAGGVALNSSANWKILKNSGFKDIYIQPAAGDSGGALGAALWAYHTVFSKSRKTVMNNTYFGACETQNETKKFLEHENINYSYSKSDNGLVERVVDAISKKKVIGWVQDEFEWGPRALGHRSIIADPSSIEMKNKVNAKIKFREGFRPFAPSVIAEDAHKYFSIAEYSKSYPLKFMLYVVPVQKDKQEKLGAITHVDGTARPQLVEKYTNPLYHNIIESYGQESGLPVILNTSFNLKGEPIVNTSKEAYKTFLKSGIDMLVLNKFVIQKK